MYVGQPRMRLWIERALGVLTFGFACGQPRMRLWIESQKAGSRISSSRWVSLVWGCELKGMKEYLDSDLNPGQPRMRLWIESSTAPRGAMGYKGQPRMRLWIERKWSSKSSIAISSGQPRMRLWIESHKIPFPLTKPSMVSLVWGCELKYSGQSLGSFLLWSASYEAVKWSGYKLRTDIVNIGLHFFLKDVRPMLPPVMNRSIVDA